MRPLSFYEIVFLIRLVTLGKTAALNQGADFLAKGAYIKYVTADKIICNAE
jgi:hypothetical protein